MEAKQNLSRTKKKKAKDPCPICDAELYLNSEFTQRIGWVDENKVVGWICPTCSSEFDKHDNIVYIYGENSIQGKA